MKTEITIFTFLFSLQNASFPAEGADFHPNEAIKGRVTFQLFWFGGKKKKAEMAKLRP